MVLVDTSVWVRHFRRGYAPFARLLEQGQVLLHPFVLGELACGNLNPRREIMEHLGSLAGPGVATDEEVLAFVEAHRLMGTGLGYIDAHLLASARLAGVGIWTFDSALRRMAQRLGVAYKPAD